MLARFSPLGLHSHRTRRPTLGLLCALAAVSVPAAAMAHPLGNFTINHYAGIRVTPDTVRLDVVLDYAEIPAFQERVPWTPTRTARCRPRRPRLPGGSLRRPRADLRLEAGAGAQPVPTAAGLAFPPGVGGLATMRLVCEFGHPCQAVDGPMTVRFEDRSNAEQIGWRDIVAHGDGVMLRARMRSPRASPTG